MDAEDPWTLEAVFGANARKIIDSTAANVTAEIDQLLAHLRDSAELRRHMTPGEQAEEEAAWLECEAAIDAMTPADWGDLADEIAETEREILRERGIEPLE